MSMSATQNKRPTTRQARIEALLNLKEKIEAEIAQIANEIRGESEALGRARAAARAADVSIPRRRKALCGTDGGYYRHRRTLKEAACEACKLAHRVAEAERVSRREVA